MADDDGFREAVQRLLLRTQASFQDTAAASVPLKRKGRKKGKGLDAAPEKEVPEVPEIPEKEVKPAERYEDLPRAFRDSFEKHREQVVSEFMMLNGGQPWIVHCKHHPWVQAVPEDPATLLASTQSFVKTSRGFDLSYADMAVTPCELTIEFRGHGTPQCGECGMELVLHNPVLDILRTHQDLREVDRDAKTVLGPLYGIGAVIPRSREAWRKACPCGCGGRLSAPKKCTQCLAVRYCGRDCQKQDWPRHKAVCRTLMEGSPDVGAVIPPSGEAWRKACPCGCCGRLSARKKCTQCKAVRYCGRDCQKQDWPRHKAVCRTLMRGPLMEGSPDVPGVR